jgi:tetratricopeptide (TPR) repeat protein
VFDIFAGKDPNKALQRAREYLREGRTDSAIKTLEDNLTEGEESFDLYIELAKLHYDAENRTRAAELLHSVQAVAPSRSDELIAAASDLFYRRTSIDIGDFLLQLHITRQEYDDVSKVLRAFNEREIKLLLGRYEKLNQLVAEKKVLTKKDFEHILILGSIRFFLHNGKEAAAELETITGVPAFNKQLVAWTRVIAREYFNDQHAGLLQLKILAGANEYEELVNLAHRVLEKFPDAVDALIETFAQARPPKDLVASFQQFLTDLYIKKGDLDASIERLKSQLKKDPSRVDDVVKALRELERISPKNLKVHYGLSDTYLEGHRVSLAIGELEKILEIDPAQYEEVLERYKKAFAIEPNNPQVIAGLVSYYLKLDAIDSAIDVIESAYKKDPGLIDEYILNLNLILERELSNPRALYLLGLCYSGKGERDNALVIVESLMDGGQLEYVESILKEAVKRSPDDPVYLNLYAKNLAVMGKEEQAMKLVKPMLKQPDKILAMLPALDVITNKIPALSDDIIPVYERHKKDEPFIYELALARIYAFRGEFEKSVKSFELCLANEDKKDTVKRALLEVVKERPKAVQLLLAAARIFMKDGEVEIATEFFKTAQAIDPKAFFEIIDEFYDTLKTYPKDREVRVLLINTFFNRKLWERVIEEAKKGTEVFGQEAQYFNLKLGQALVESGNLTDGVRPLMLSLDGEENYAEDVIRYLNKILEIDKSNVPAHFARGRALARARRTEEAVEEYLLTARIVPARAEYVLDELKSLAAKAIANPKIIFAMGSVEIALKRNDEAIKHLLQACELDTTLVKRVIPIYEKLLTSDTSPILQYSLARVYHLAGINNSAVQLFISAQAQNKDYREPAITELKQICTEDPKDLESRKGLAEIYFGYNNYEDALSLVEEIYNMSPQESGIKSFIFEILNKNPSHIPSYYLLVKVFLNEQNYAKAIEVAKKIISLVPSETIKVVEMMLPFHEQSTEIHFYAAVVYMNTGDLQTAASLFEELFLRDPASGEAIAKQLHEMLVKNSSLTDAYLLLSKILAFRHEYDKAIESVKRALVLKPGRYEELQLRIAQFCFDMGDIKRAVEIYNEVLSRTKDRKAIYRMIRKTHHDYIEEKVRTITGVDDDDRLSRANLYLLIDNVSAAEKELQFAPTSSRAARMRTILGAKVYLKKNRPMDAFETLRNLVVDAETAPVYADVYEALGSYEAAASVLRQCDAIGLSERISKLEKLAQARIVFKGRYYIEGRI